MIHLVTERGYNDAVIEYASEESVKRDGQDLIIYGVTYTPEVCDFHEMEESQLPELDKMDIIGKYSYTTEKGFFENEQYIPPNPYGIPNELQEQILSDYREQLAQEVSENGYDA